MADIMVSVRLLKSPIMSFVVLALAIGLGAALLSPAFTD